MSIKSLVDILYHVSFELEISCRHPIHNTLNGRVNFPKNAELLTTIGELSTLEVCEAQLELSHKIVVNHCEGWGWEEWGGQHRKWPASAGKHKLTVTVLALITGCNEVWFGGRHVPQADDVLAGDLNWDRLGWEIVGRENAKPCHVRRQCRGLGLEVDVPLQLRVANVDVAWLPLRSACASSTSLLLVSKAAIPRFETQDVCTTTVTGAYTNTALQ